MQIRAGREPSDLGREGWRQARRIEVTRHTGGVCRLEGCHNVRAVTGPPEREGIETMHAGRHAIDLRTGRHVPRDRGSHADHGQGSDHPALVDRHVETEVGPRPDRRVSPDGDAGRKSDRVCDLYVVGEVNVVEHEAVGPEDRRADAAVMDHDTVSYPSARADADLVVVEVPFPRNVVARGCDLGRTAQMHARPDPHIVADKERTEKNGIWTDDDPAPQPHPRADDRARVNSGHGIPPIWTAGTTPAEPP